LGKIQAERGGLENVTVESLRNKEAESITYPSHSKQEDGSEADEATSQKLFTTDDLAAMRNKMTEMLMWEAE
jgi:hypothetical protein